jgi:hypothetical protein
VNVRPRLLDAARLLGGGHARRGLSDGRLDGLPTDQVDGGDLVETGPGAGGRPQGDLGPDQRRQRRVSTGGPDGQLGPGQQQFRPVRVQPTNPDLTQGGRGPCRDDVALGVDHGPPSVVLEA